MNSKFRKEKIAMPFLWTRYTLTGLNHQKWPLTQNARLVLSVRSPPWGRHFFHGGSKRGECNSPELVVIALITWTNNRARTCRYLLFIPRKALWFLFNLKMLIKKRRRKRTSNIIRQYLTKWFLFLFLFYFFSLASRLLPSHSYSKI